MACDKLGLREFRRRRQLRPNSKHWHRNFKTFLLQLTAIKLGVSLNRFCICDILRVTNVDLSSWSKNIL